MQVVLCCKRGHYSHYNLIVSAFLLPLARENVYETFASEGKFQDSMLLYSGKFLWRKTVVNLMSFANIIPSQVQLRNFDSVTNKILCILSCAKDNIGPSQA